GGRAGRGRRPPRRGPATEPRGGTPGRDGDAPLARDRGAAPDDGRRARRVVGHGAGPVHLVRAHRVRARLPLGALGLAALRHFFGHDVAAPFGRLPVGRGDRPRENVDPPGELVEQVPVVG